MKPYCFTLLGRLAIFFLLLAPFYSVSQSCTCPSVQVSGQNFSGQNLTGKNFTTYPANYLVNANFQGAILVNAQFGSVNLSGANFTSTNCAGADFTNANLTGTTFCGSNLDSAALPYATFSGTSFMNCTMLSTSFGPIMNIKPGSSRTTFACATVDLSLLMVKNWPSGYWPLTDFSYTRFINLSPYTFPTRGLTMSKAILKGINLTYFDLTKSILDSVDFTNASLSYATLDSAIMSRVNLTGAYLIDASLIATQFYQSQFSGVGATMYNATVSNANLAYANLQYALLSGANLMGANLQDVHLENSTFEANGLYNVAVLIGSNCDSAFFNSSHLNEVNFQHSSLIGTNFNNLTLENTNFQNAIMTGVNFQGSTLQGVSFSGAILQNANFTGVTITGSSNGAGVDFSCTQLGGSNFSTATVVKANFANAVIPPDSLCCPQVDSSFYCGRVNDGSNMPYGKTTLPLLKAPVVCPNGDVAICSGTQWSVPNWQTRNCNPSGTMQVLWSPPDCGGGDTSKIVVFSDPNLQKCVENQLFGQKSGVVTQALAAQVVMLECPCMQIKTLGGLQNFTSLRVLNLEGNQISDPGNTFIILDSLQVLNISNNQISVLQLDGLSMMVALDVSGNGLSTLTGMEVMYLQYLDASYNNLANINLQIQTTLNYANLSFNNLTTVTPPLTNLTGLETLLLQGNSLSTIGSVQKLYNNGNGALQILNIGCNPGFDCSSLGLGGSFAGQNFLNTTYCGDTKLPECQGGQ